MKEHHKEQLFRITDSNGEKVLVASDSFKKAADEYLGFSLSRKADFRKSKTSNEMIVSFPGKIRPFKIEKVENEANKRSSL